MYALYINYLSMIAPMIGANWQVWVAMIPDPVKCPWCNNDENTKLVCRNCGHEYVDEDDEPTTFLDNVIIAIIVIFFISLFFTIVFTFFNWIGGNDHFTLIDAIKESYHWWGKLLNRIW